MVGGVKWPLLGYLGVYLCLIVMRNTLLKYSSKDLSLAKKLCDNRQVDISDSRLSNFDSDSSGRELDTEEMLMVDRVFPLTKTLNRVMDKFCRKFSLFVTLEDKKILSLENEFLNLTYFESEYDNETERRVFGRNAFLSRLDSLKRLGNAYIALDTDKTIVLVQKLQFQILKESFDFYDSGSTYLGGCSFSFNNNAFVLSTELSTSYDNSECRIKSVSFECVPDNKSLKLKVEGLSETDALYKKLKSVLYDHFVTKVSAVIEQELLPILTKLIHEADICSYFDAKRNSNSNLPSHNDSYTAV